MPHRASRRVSLLAAWMAVAAAAASGSQSSPAGGPPAWAYGVASPGATAPAAGRGAPPDDGSAKQVPESSQRFTLAQLRDGFTIADWFPADHPAPPDIVMKGRRPDARACGLCHYPTGRGRPENSAINGLPRAYFIQQMDDFRRDLRKSAEPRKTNTNLMSAIARAISDEEIAQAADYFAAIPATPWVKVVESATVPAMRLAGGMFVPLAGGATEPIGDRIIEVPEFPERTDLRDPRAGFIAYVPPGAIARGRALATDGLPGKPATACAICHGADLRGLGPVPGIAGRSPSYQVRQLYDMQAGTRRGAWTSLMKPVVDGMTAEQMLAVAAYAASRAPGQ
jgi:cytochrome c553